MKILILNALGGGAIAATGCAHDRNARAEDAAPGEAEQDSGPSAAASGGKGGKGGQGGIGGVGGVGGQLAPGCFRNPVGTCCAREYCMSLQPLDDLDASSDDAGGKEFPACPKTLPSTGTCASYSDLQSSTNGRCCYTFTSVHVAAGRSSWGPKRALHTCARASTGRATTARCRSRSIR
ncbi:MAG TPA: hypothetical protein VJV78_20415 [Polyangiales bacterium]|nr:hypothetical protein [Polyangiales bacterium]